MKPPCVLLVDGPVSIYLYDATEEEIVAALNRLRPALTVAAKQIGASNAIDRACGPSENLERTGDGGNPTP